MVSKISDTKEEDIMTILRDRYSSFPFHSSIPSPKELGKVLSEALKKRPDLDSPGVRIMTLSVILKHRRLQRRIRITGVPPKISKMTHVVTRYKHLSSVWGIAVSLMARNK